MSAFGPRLRTWRLHRGHTQERLAHRAEVSQRHLSAIENGRAVPSAELIGHLARTLDIPPRDENDLLLAAGHAPRRVETPLDELDDVRMALTFMLEAHDPHPAVVVDHRWTLVDANDAATGLIAALVPNPPLLDGTLNLMHLLLDPAGLRPMIENWSECGPTLGRAVADESARQPDDPVLADLVRRFAASLPQRPDSTSAGSVVSMRLRTPVGPISLFTCLSVLLGPIDITAAELRLETFFPTDEASRARLEALLG